MRNKAKLALAILVLLAIVIVMFNFLGKSYIWSAGKPSSEVINIRIGLLPIEDSVPFIVAKYEDLYAKYGVNASIVMYGSAMGRDSAFTAGLIDVALNDPITTLILADKGVNLKIISLLLGEYPEDGLFYLLASPDSDIEVPKSIAISQNTIIEFAAWHIIKGLNVNPGSINWIDVPPIPVRFQMLIEGKVEGTVLPDPWGTLAIAKGAKLIADDKILKTPITMTVIIARSDVASHSVALKLRSILNEALRLYKANPEKYREVIEKEIFIPEELKGKWLPKWRGNIVDYPKNNFELVNSWLLEKNLISKPLSYEAITLVLKE
ncbi:MAG: ABC transporter substrate-binding protein [Nitrososphaerota archaeon]